MSTDTFSHAIFYRLALNLHRIRREAAVQGRMKRRLSPSVYLYWMLRKERRRGKSRAWVAGFAIHYLALVGYDPIDRLQDAVHDFLAGLRWDGL